jgi:hypothetical protein
LCNAGLISIALAVANNALCAGVPVESRGRDLLVVATVLAPITLVIILLRCYSRYLVANGFSWDDWSILVAAVRAI